MELKIGMKFYYEDRNKRLGIVDKIVSITEDHVTTNYLDPVTNTTQTYTGKKEEIIKKIKYYGLVGNSWEVEPNYRRNNV